MNEEEKERIKHLIERCNECKLNTCITCDITWSEVQAIEKQQAEIETLKRDFEIVDHECSRLEQEDIKKDKLINILAEQLTTPIHSKEWVIDYYKREIEKV